MHMPAYKHFKGVLIDIQNFPITVNDNSGCHKIMTLQDNDGSIVNFVVRPDTYFVDHVTLRVGDVVVGFYDINRPAVLIYPPRYTAVVMARVSKRQNVTVDYFNENLLNRQGTLQLNIGVQTQVLLTNDQQFQGNLGNRDLIVVYDFTTRSIPAQTTPSKIIVLCY